MQNLLNPRWVLLINTLPIIVLLSLMFQQFYLIQSFLKPENINLWYGFGFVLLLYAIVHAGYMVSLINRKEVLPPLYGPFTLFSYILLLYIYIYHSNNFISFNVPRWMLGDDMTLSVSTFLMPTLAHALFVSVVHFTKPDQKLHTGLNFGALILIPIFFYILFQCIAPLWQLVGGEFGLHLTVILFIVITVLFLFFLLRGLFILAIRKTDTWKEYQLAWKIPIALLLPLLGLIINNGDIRVLSGNGVYMFGNFSSLYFYLLAILNGVFVCLPNLDKQKYRLLIFIGRMFTFTYTLYFFLVFLPFLPLSLIAILAFGLGFLMLVPLLLFIIHTNELVQDVYFLKQQQPTRKLLAVGLVAFFTLPIFTTINYLCDKHNLKETLDYLYNPDYSKAYDINPSSLKRTLAAIALNKGRSNSLLINNKKTPFLSSYFNYLVLDNLTLPKNKIDYIEAVFFDKTLEIETFDNINNTDVKISNIEVESEYDETQDAWLSWVHLEITNEQENRWQAEYATNFELPAGCWISDHYLYVGDRKEMGILSERKSAIWVYSQIRNTRRDPSVLYYLSGDRVAFRVFPFRKKEVRKTGIQFIHKEALTLEIDDCQVHLGKINEHGISNVSKTENGVYVPANQKKNLKRIQREPYLHFIVDVSSDSNFKNANILDEKVLEPLLNKYPELMKNAKMSLVNSDVYTFDLKENWKEKHQIHKSEGGFFADRAIREILANSYLEAEARHPVLVLLTENQEEAILQKDFADLAFTYPEMEYFLLGSDYQTFDKYPLRNQIHRPLGGIGIDTFWESKKYVRIYPFEDGMVSYLPDNGKASIALHPGKPYFLPDEEKAKQWKTGLAMQTTWMSQQLYPEMAATNWLVSLQQSFRSKIMNPLTSYLALENEAQKKMLKRKQAEVLAGNQNLDLTEQTRRMSEPNIWMLLGILILLFCCQKCSTILIA